MKEVQNRYQFIIGFVAIIISLSAFKDELKTLLIDLGFVKFSASQYLLFLIISFVALVHLYSIPYILSSTSFASSKFLNRLEYISYGLFIALLASPSILLFIYLVKIFSIKILSLDEKMLKWVLASVSGLVGVIASSVFKKLTAKIKEYITSIEQNQLEVKEIKALEIANSLFEDKYYNQSYVESFKALENTLFKRLRQEELIFRPGNFMQMVDIAKKYNLLNNKEFDEIQQIRAKRNSISHSTAQQVTKVEAEAALQFIRGLVSKIEVDADSETTKDQPNPGQHIVDHAAGSLVKPYSYFNGLVFDDLTVSKSESQLQEKPIFLVIYDSKSVSKSKIDYSLKYFTEYETTKALLKNNFIQVVADVHSPGIEKYLPIDEPLENCLILIITPADEVFRMESVYANPDEGLKIVKSIIESWNNKK